jgi:hypothetical protein
LATGNELAVGGIIAFAELIVGVPVESFAILARCQRIYLIYGSRAEATA